MTRTTWHIPTVALLLALTATGLMLHAEASGKLPSDTAVTTTIDGLGIDTTPTLRIQSDQLGTYKNSNSLRSIIQGIGDWELDMINFNSSPQRKALIDFRDPVPGTSPNGGAPTAPFAYQFVRARFISKCTQNGIKMLSMQMNTPYFCPLAVAFDDASGVRYRLASNPTNFSETNWVQITCIGTDASGRCSQWRIEPSVVQPSGELKNTTKLLKVATKPRETDQDMGDFYMSFSIHLTNP